MRPGGSTRSARCRTHRGEDLPVNFLIATGRVPTGIPAVAKSVAPGAGYDVKVHVAIPLTRHRSVVLQHVISFGARRGDHRRRLSRQMSRYLTDRFGRHLVDAHEVSTRNQEQMSIGKRVGIQKRE